MSAPVSAGRTALALVEELDRAATAVSDASIALVRVTCDGRGNPLASARPVELAKMLADGRSLDVYVRSYADFVGFFEKSAAPTVVALLRVLTEAVERFRALAAASFEPNAPAPSLLSAARPFRSAEGDLDLPLAFDPSAFLKAGDYYRVVKLRAGASSGEVVLRPVKVAGSVAGTTPSGSLVLLPRKEEARPVPVGKLVSNAETVSVEVFPSGPLDTLVAPLRDGTFETFGIGSYYTKASERLGRTSYVAAYRVAPVSAIVSIAKILGVFPLEDGRVRVSLGPPEVLKTPIPYGSAATGALQTARYANREKLLRAKDLSEVFPRRGGPK